MLIIVVILQDLLPMEHGAFSIPFNYNLFKSWRLAPAHKSFSCHGTQEDTTVLVISLKA